LEPPLPPVRIRR